MQWTSDRDNDIYSKSIKKQPLTIFIEHTWFYYYLESLKRFNHERVLKEIFMSIVSLIFQQIIVIDKMPLLTAYMVVTC